MIIPLRSILLLTLGVLSMIESFGFDRVEAFYSLAILDGCTDENACNFDVSATADDGSCEYLSCLVGCMDSVACNFNPNALYPNNGVCNYLTCAGCMDASACNFDDSATIANGDACDYSCFGCSDFTACNFDSAAAITDFTACIYPNPNFDCDGNPTGCGGCEPVFISALNGGTVTCVDELPMTIAGNTIAVGSCSGDTLPHAVFTADMREEIIMNAGFTGDGSGTDGAIRIFGLTALGLSESDYFIENYPLILTRFNNGFATLSGEVVNSENPNLKWSVHLTFEDAQPASTWLSADEAHGLVPAYGCELNPEEVLVYRLKADQSFLIGKDGYLNSYLQLNHMPFNENKRFQLGVGANSSTCALGLGGWFAWEGQVLGVPVMGMTGDVVIDLSADGAHPVACGSESTAHFYSALNSDCGQLTEIIQFFNRMDTVPPVWTGDCATDIFLCTSITGLTPDIPLPCVPDFTDSCADPLTFAFAETLVSGDSLDGGAFVLERTHSAEDCSGNMGVFVQTITFDGVTCPEQMEQTGSDGDYFVVQTEQEQVVSASDWKEHNRAISDLRLYPNPSNGMAELSWSSQRPGEVTIDIFQTDGSAVLPAVTRLMPSNAGQRITLDGSSLPAGTYFVRIRFNHDNQVIPWLIVD